jgi:hypothetical protein
MQLSRNTFRRTRKPGIEKNIAHQLFRLVRVLRAGKERHYETFTRRFHYPVNLNLL